MTDTQKNFDKIIRKTALVVKLVNEEVDDEPVKNEINELNDEISDLTCDIIDEKNDFVELKDLKNYIIDIIGKNYFADKREISYLYDSVYDVYKDMNNILEEEMQTGLGMQQQLPTNSTYDGGIFDIYDNDEEEKKDMERLEEKRINEEDRIEALAQFLGLDEEEKEDIEVDDETLTYDSEEYLVVTEDEGYEMAKEDVQNFLEYDMGLEGVSESTQEYALENFCTYDWESDLHSFNESYCNDIKSEYDNEYGSRLVQECDDRVGLDDEDGGWVASINGEYIQDKKYLTDDLDKAKRFLKEEDAYPLIDDFLDWNGKSSDDEDVEYSVDFYEDLVDFDDLSEKLTEELDKDYNSMAEWFDSIYGSDWVSEMRDTLKDYIDWEALAEYVVDGDGVANTLARYDGKSNEEKVNGEWFYIYRTN